jgi:hypothetical protein
MVAVAAAAPPVPTSPVARSIEFPAIAPDADLLVFPGDKLARVDDFVRLRLQARTITFLGVLQREGITPEHYQAMCARFDAARRADPSLEARYRARMDVASRRRGV